MKQFYLRGGNLVSAPFEANARQTWGIAMYIIKTSI